MPTSLRSRACIAVLTCSLGGTVAAADLAVRLSDASGRPLADAVVFLPVAGSAARQPGLRRASIVQRHRVFDPFVTVIEKGTAVDFPNEDSILHHVYSFSPARRFEIKLYKGTPASPVVFDTTGIVALGCNMHDWMLAYVLVVDTPHFAKSGNDGIARIGGVPGGAFDLMGWYPGMREPVRLRRINLPADAAQPVEHRLDVAPKTRPAAPPHDPMRY